MAHIGELLIECPLKPVFTLLVQAGASCQWVDDSQHLLLEHFDVIKDSPSQIYQSLLLSPLSSWLHKYYGAEFSGVVKVVGGLTAGWGTCFRTVRLANIPEALACWKDTIAAGLNSGSIIILSAITGSHMAILSEHTGGVKSLAFSSDGASLVSGSRDSTLKLWDVQTGGVVKTFYGHTECVRSVSISADCIMIASVSWDGTIHLWDISTGECHYSTKQEKIYHIVFSPTDPHQLISNSVVQGWDIESYQVESTHGSDAAFSSDGTHFISHSGTIATVQNSDSRAIVARCQTDTNDPICRSCLSPNSSLVAAVCSFEIYIWDITNSDPLLIETISVDGQDIISLTFSSPTTLISTSFYQSIMFWQVGISTSPATGDLLFIPPPSASVMSVSLQAENGIAISRDRDGVVRVWDIQKGHCKASFKTLARNPSGDVRMIDGSLILVWLRSGGFNIWDGSEGKLLHSVDFNWDLFCGLRISGDGSKFFCLAGMDLQAWSIQTGGAVGGVEVEGATFLDPLCVDGSKIWVNCRGKPAQGWDFGIPGSSPVLLSNTPSGRPRLHFIHDFNTPPRIEDTVTGKVVFWLSGRYTGPEDVRWDGQYLVAGYQSGEVLILDFKHLCLD
jgi:WD40 repeat protein